MAKLLRIPKLNDQLLIEIMKKALINANTLIEDGDLLYEYKRYQRAYAMYQLATEEIGKALYSMVHMISDYKDFDKRIVWYNDIFYKHKPKSILSTDIDVVAVSLKFAGKPQEYMSFYKEHLGFSSEIDYNQLEKNRMNSFYVDCVDDRVLLPSEMINEEMCTKLKSIVNVRYDTASGAVNMVINTYTVIRDDFEQHPELIAPGIEHTKNQAAKRIFGDEHENPNLSSR